MKAAVAAEIEKIIVRDPGHRGIGALQVPGDLARAAQSLLFARTVFILTGFYVKAAGTGETDGPAGAVVLGKALTQLQKKVVILTDDYNYAIVQGAVAAYNVPAPVVRVALAADAAYYNGLLNAYRPSHIIAVERPGQARDGRCYNMRGEDISPYTAKDDTLIAIGRKKGCITIGIGDGGNEIGMGKVRHRVQAAVRHGDKIAAVTATDYLITAGVTNWGAYGLAAYLSVLQGTDLLHNPAWESTLLDAVLRKGAVDGVTAAPTRHIDGLPVETHCRLIEELKDCVLAHINPRRAPVVSAAAN